MSRQHRVYNNPASSIGLTIARQAIVGPAGVIADDENISVSIKNWDTSSVPTPSDKIDFMYKITGESNLRSGLYCLCWGVAEITGRGRLTGSEADKLINNFDYKHIVEKTFHRVQQVDDEEQLRKLLMVRSNYVCKFLGTRNDVTDDKRYRCRIFGGTPYDLSSEDIKNFLKEQKKRLNLLDFYHYIIAHIAVAVASGISALQDGGVYGMHICRETVGIMAESTTNFYNMTVRLLIHDASFHTSAAATTATAPAGPIDAVTVASLESCPDKETDIVDFGKLLFHLLLQKTYTVSAAGGGFLEMETHIVGLGDLVDYMINGNEDGARPSANTVRETLDGFAPTSHHRVI